MSKKLYFLFFCFSISLISYAQNATEIKGRIIDEQSKTPISGITLFLQHNRQTAVSNSEGLFIFVNLTEGADTLVAQSATTNRLTQRITIKAGKSQTLPDIELAQTYNINAQTNWGFIDDDMLNADDDGEGQDIRSAVILSNDMYLNKVGFKLSPFRFRIRGYELLNEQTFINGVNANDQYRRVFNFASIGALNDLTRNGDVINYNNGGQFTLGAIGGSRNINMRASTFAKGGKATVSYTNRNYYGRAIASYSTGLLDNGWAVTAAAGSRYAHEGVVDGTSYNNFAYTLSVEKQWKDGAHSLSLVTYGSPVARGQQGASFQEVYDLTGNNLYNPNWGYQNGEVRNSRVVKAFDPTAILSHIWKIDEKTSLTSGGSMHYGRYSNTSLNWYNAMDPRPDYYRYLPSYFSMDPSTTSLETVSLYEDLWRAGDPTVTQINWDELYRQNRNPEYRRKNHGAALYMVEERHSDLLEGTINTTFNKLFASNIRLTSGVEARKTRSYQYKTVNDLLGADYVLDVDKFAERDNPGNQLVIQNDLLYPNRQAYIGDIFGYDFDLDIQSANAWAINHHQTRHIDFFYGGKLSYTDFQRTGNMMNGRFPNSSYGKGEKHSFLDYTIKGGATYKINGRHFVYANTAYISEPPIPDRAYAMSRTTDQVVNGLSSSKIFATDIGYVFSTPRFAGRVSAYQTKFYDQLERMSYYHDSERTFVFHNLSGVDKIHQGIEANITYKLNDNWNFDFIGTVAEHYYSSNPLGTLNSENGKLVNVEETVYLKNTYVAGTPQFAGVLAARYFYDYWFFEVSANAVGRTYLSAAPLRRLASNYIDINPFDDTALNAYQILTTQERLDDIVTVDASIGKLFYLKNRKSINMNFSAMNLLNKKDIRTGGFEQGRLDTTYPNRFASKYFYMQGLNVFLNLSYRF